MGMISDNINRFFPYLGMKFINIPSARKRWKHTLEENIINGGKLPIHNEIPSIIFFSVHKAGSSISLRFLQKLAGMNNLNVLNYDAYVASLASEKKYLYEEENFLKNSFLDKGYFFGCFREYFRVPNEENYKVILLLRDPRDVLVSYYYSMKYTNRIHHIRGVKARRRVNKIDVNQYVIEILPRFKKVYESYINNLVGKPHVVFTKYEDLIVDSKSWLYTVNDFCNLKVSNELINEIQNTINPHPKKENKKKHLRKAIPGDYKNKLSRETIDKINHELKSILNSLQYEL